MTRFTVSFGSSSYVIRSVRPALYAGITTTTLGARTVSGIGRAERAALGPREHDEHAQRIHEVLQDVAVQDRVERAGHLRDLAVEVGREHPLAVASAGLRQCRVALEAGDAPAALREAPAHDPVGRPDVEDPPAATPTEPLEDHRVAAVRVRLDGVPWSRAIPVPLYRMVTPQ